MLVVEQSYRAASRRHLASNILFLAMSQAVGPGNERRVDV